jgi:vacuolar-type H+-ATPase subunit I/STV1
VLGLATLGVSQFRVAESIRVTNEDLEQTKASLATSQTNERNAKRQATEAKTTSEKLRTDLETAQKDLEDVQAKAREQQERADENESKLKETTRSLNDTRDKLAEWEATGMTPLQVRETQAQNRKFASDVQGLAMENRTLDRNLRRVTEELRKFKGEESKVELPSELRGKVLAVDPKYEFVVLDIGEDDGALERGEMLVSRNGKLVAKVRILTVQSKRCIANVLGDWKQADVMEGDQVVVGL